METFCYVCGLIEDINYTQGCTEAESGSLVQLFSRCSAHSIVFVGWMLLNTDTVAAAEAANEPEIIAIYYGHSHTNISRFKHFYIIILYDHWHYRTREHPHTDNTIWSNLFLLSELQFQWVRWWCCRQCDRHKTSEKPTAKIRWNISTIFLNYKTMAMAVPSCGRLRVDLSASMHVIITIWKISESLGRNHFSCNNVN